MPQKILLHQLYLAKKTRAERKFIKEEKCRNAVAFQVFLTQRNFLCAEYLMARFSWGSNNLRKVIIIPFLPPVFFSFETYPSIIGQKSAIFQPKMVDYSKKLFKFYFITNYQQVKL